MKIIGVEPRFQKARKKGAEPGLVLGKSQKEKLTIRSSFNLTLSIVVLTFKIFRIKEYLKVALSILIVVPSIHRNRIKPAPTTKALVPSLLKNRI